METMLVMVLLAGAGCWAVKQWKSLSPPPSGGGGLIVRPSDTIIEAGAWQAEPPKPKLNKYLILGLCIAYILFPLDFIPDFLPIAGWGDDLAAGIIGIKALFRKA